MIIFLYGADDYRRLKKKKELIAEFQKKYSLIGAEAFDFLQEDAPAKFQNFVRSSSMFGTHKLAVLDNIFGDAAEQKEIRSVLHSLATNKDTTVLISEAKTPPKAFAFLANKPTIVQKFDFITGYNWELFIKKEALTRDLSLTPTALHFLAEAYKEDTWRLITELEKISFSGKKKIDREELEFFNIEITPDFWTLLNNLKARETGRRLASLERMFTQNEPLARIFNTLAYQWQEKLQFFADYDAAVKSGKLDYEEALLDLALQ